MKRIIFLYYMIALLSLLSCQKDASIEIKDYPKATTLVPEINSSGVLFKADLTNIGTSAIAEYGFVWSRFSDPDMYDAIRLVEKEPQKGQYELRINSGLAKDQTYHVRSYVKTASHIVYGNDISFTSQGSLPPEITSFSPKAGKAGDQIVIEGIHFSPSPSENVVKFGHYLATVESTSANKLVVTVPEVLSGMEVNITVETASMTCYSQSPFDIWHPWTRKNLNFYPIYSSASFVINNSAYVINLNSSYILRYTPDDDDWYIMPLPLIPNNKVMAYASGDVAYVILDNTFWEFNPTTNTWTPKAAFPGTLNQDARYNFGFSIDGKVYIGGCYKNYQFWEYDPVNNTWQQKANFVGNFNGTSPVWGHYSFTVDNHGYLGVSQTAFANNTLWKYFPSTDSWEQKQGIPSDAYNNYACFVIDNNAYVGLGRNFNWGDGYVSNQMWKYDHVSDGWIQYKNCPDKMSIYASFSVNNKGYVFPGNTSFSERVFYMYEFDPSKN